jgi:hypothetical protein
VGSLPPTVAVPPSLWSAGADTSADRWESSDAFSHSAEGAVDRRRTRPCEGLWLSGRAVALSRHRRSCATRYRRRHRRTRWWQDCPTWTAGTDAGRHAFLGGRVGDAGVQRPVRVCGRQKLDHVAGRQRADWPGADPVDAGRHLDDGLRGQLGQGEPVRHVDRELGDRRPGDQCGGDRDPAFGLAAVVAEGRVPRRGSGGPCPQPVRGVRLLGCWPTPVPRAGPRTTRAGQRATTEATPRGCASPQASVGRVRTEQSTSRRSTGRGGRGGVEEILEGALWPSVGDCPAIPVLEQIGAVGDVTQVTWNRDPAGSRRSTI